MNIESIQKQIHKSKLDGWLLYDFRGSNDIACRFLGIKTQLVTRRFFYWIPREGEPVKIVHGIEKQPLNHLPGEERVYYSWSELNSALENLLDGKRTIAMEYSKNGALPTLSKVDGGTIDLVRTFGIEVVSSGPLLQTPLTLEQIRLHKEAASHLDRIVENAWNLISERLKQNVPINEFDVRQEILSEMQKRGLETDSGPICAVGAHSADPHYIPEKETAVRIQKGDFVLIDLWAKRAVPGSIYADICRVAVCDTKPTSRQRELFSIVREAQKKATDLLKEAKPLMGWEVDKAARDVIEKSGYGNYFFHRTGHNIDSKDHGDGTNLDNYETKDNRRLLPGSCFSIEPGIYLPGDFGIRLEYNIVFSAIGSIEITGGVQEEIRTLL
ncbi:MAG: Xaa-Pro peptidase family protein [Waddliaceae bacterium]